MQRLKEIVPAFDRRDLDPNKDYGIHGAEIRMVLKGELGAVQFVIYSNRHLRHVVEELVEKYDIPDKYKEDLINYSGDFTPGKEIQELIEYQNTINLMHLSKTYLYEPIAADIGYHSPKPMYDGQNPSGVFTKYSDDYSEKIGTEGEPRPCEYLDGKPCYYDGSGLQANRVYKDILMRHGEEAVWQYLEDYYKTEFGELK